MDPCFWLSVFLLATLPSPAQEKEPVEPIDLRCPDADLPQLAEELAAGAGISCTGENNVAVLVRSAASRTRSGRRSRRS